MDLAARETLAKLIRHETRTELAAGFDTIATELEELRLRVHVLEAQAGIPTVPTGVRLRQREAARMRDQGDSLNKIAATLRMSPTTAKDDIARERATVAPDGNAGNGKHFGDRRDRVV